MFYQPVPPAKHMSDTDALWELQLPASVMQFFCLLHNLRPRDPLWASPEFLQALAGVVFPVESSEVCEFLWIYQTLTALISSGFIYWLVHFLQGVVESCANSEGDITFKHQSSRKPVCDFIRILLMDSLLNVSANTSEHPLILLLEVNAHTQE